MPLPQVMIIGNLTADPDLKFTASGTAICKFSVATQDRKRDDSGKWVDGDPTYLDVTAWRQTGENCAETLQKGDRVVVWGRLRQRSYTTKDGDKRTAFEVEADDVAASLYKNAATVRRTSRVSGSASDKSATDDPWAMDAPF